MGVSLTTKRESIFNIPSKCNLDPTSAASKHGSTLFFHIQVFVLTGAALPAHLGVSPSYEVDEPSAYGSGGALGSRIRAEPGAGSP